MSKFQIIVLSAFVAFTILGVILFATYKGKGQTNTSLPPITIWGTFSGDTFKNYVSSYNQTSAVPLNITYIEKKESTFSQDFISALAKGKGPDAILIPADMILPHIDKITPIPYTAFDQRTFMNTFIQEGEIYLNQNGILAIPFIVDPLVMYVNRDSFSSAGLATYPQYWEDFTSLKSKLTSIDQNGNIRKSAIAMGDFTNVDNAREILGTLIMQKGNSITTLDSTGLVTSALGGTADPSSAVSYFVQFDDPNGPFYSWNRGMPDSRTAFLSGSLATYFGFASELSSIRQKNPNLNFDVGPLPQFKKSATKLTYGRMYGLSILKSSPNQNGVFQIFNILTNSDNISALSKTLYMPSVLRSSIASQSSDPYISIFNSSALVSKTWLDADRNQSFSVFGDMVNSITSGSKNIREAIKDADDKYDVVLRQAQQ